MACDTQIAVTIFFVAALLYFIFALNTPHQQDLCCRIVAAGSIGTLKPGNHVSGLGKSKTTSAVAWYDHPLTTFECL